MKKVQTKKDNEIFSRFEFKYIIKKNVSEAIQNEVKNFTKIDSYASSKGKYLVRSLYFDNNLFTNFHEKVDGIKKRYKFRIRTYEDHDDFNTPLFLEMKGRNNLRTYKVRTKINKNDLNLFYKQKNLPYLKHKYLNNKLIEQYIYIPLGFV